ncbi:MAG: MFS transporter, partial [Nocardioides sp.]
AATATRNLPMHLAGAGSGVYNATRQVGSVMGSAAIAVIMDARISHHFAELGSNVQVHGEAGAQQIKDPHVADLFSQAMSDAVWLPVLLFVIGFVAVMFYERPQHTGFAAAPGAVPAEAHSLD